MRMLMSIDDDDVWQKRKSTMGERSNYTQAKTLYPCDVIEIKVGSTTGGSLRYSGESPRRPAVLDGGTTALSMISVGKKTQSSDGKRVRNRLTLQPSKTTGNKNRDVEQIISLCSALPLSAMRSPKRLS